MRTYSTLVWSPTIALDKLRYSSGGGRHVSLGKILWAERDPDDKNLGEAVNWVFRREFDRASKNALVHGLVQRGYATYSPEKGVWITTVLTGSGAKIREVNAARV
ncbi:hypothetical protein FPQ18DRAFT_379177 [Pyronema domesticum]|uniref:Uncharacterized protein n=1 Tax=Pyronema omphalodes (strain CBS 100304) TaxID=1076935 RepID=U4LAH7_PYROM|nr:hypothetical protein FPQ18DRAFT_379177 [Pyronema domesticum]CCX16438.1 Protein of unknown function [Pyronema omphalodes CBS 100304]